MREGAAVTREKMERNLRRERKLRETKEREIECRSGDAIGRNFRKREGLGRRGDRERESRDRGSQGKKVREREAAREQERERLGKMRNEGESNHRRKP